MRQSTKPGAGEGCAGDGRGPLGLQGSDAGLLLLRHPAQDLGETLCIWAHGHSACIWRLERKGDNFMDPKMMDQDEGMRLSGFNSTSDRRDLAQHC